MKEVLSSAWLKSSLTSLEKQRDCEKSNLIFMTRIRETLSKLRPRFTFKALKMNFAFGFRFSGGKRKVFEQPGKPLRQQIDCRKS